MGRKRKIIVIDRTEDVCFYCKDGGSLRLCDFKNCVKGYHPHCVENDSLLESEEDWFCGWHFCNICHKPAKFQCFCCQFAVCGRCLCDTEFAVVKGKKGLCNTCLELALLIEDKKSVNFNGVAVDFSDRETYEYLFKCYWELVKEEQRLTSERLHSSYNLLKDGKNCDFQANDNYEEDASDNDEVFESDADDLNQVQYYRSKKRRKLPLTKRKGKSKKKEFLGWASRKLTEFLTSTGKSVMQELSQHDVATIVIQYCNEHKLFDPEKRNKVICDERLQSLFGRKSVIRNRVYKLLTVHFAENFEQSEDSVQSSSKKEDDNVLVRCKSQCKSIPDRNFEEKEIAWSPPRGYLAAIISKNIKLVYLKRSLVEELAQYVDTFYDKMMGSFVRVRSDPYDYLQKNSYMLVQVKGIEIKEGTSIILLQVSNMYNDVPLTKLSDDDLTEEECEDLCQRMRTGRLKRPTVVELEQKARTLHEDITRHWITKERVSLQNKINRANEKGWRRELSQYMEQMQLIENHDYRLRLMHEIPVVVADVLEPEKASDYYPREGKGEHKVSSESSESNGGSRCRNDGMDDAGKPPPEEPFVSHDPCDHSKFTATRGETDETERNRPSQEVKQSCCEISILHSLLQTSDCQSNTHNQENEHANASGEKLNQPMDIGGHEEVEKPVEVIDISDDDEAEVTSVAMSEKTSNKLDDEDWYYIGPSGTTKGPYSITLLKEWSDNKYSDLPFKVMKSGQKQEEAVLLTEAIRQILKS